MTCVICPIRTCVFSGFFMTRSLIEKSSYCMFQDFFIYIFCNLKSIWFYVICWVINVIRSWVSECWEIKPPCLITWWCVFCTRTPGCNGSWISSLLIFGAYNFVGWPRRKTFTSVKSRLRVSNYCCFFCCWTILLIFGIVSIKRYFSVSLMSV